MGISLKNNLLQVLSMENYFIYSKDTTKRRHKKNVNVFCNNCNQYGHIFKTCPEPVISFGVVLASVDNIDETLLEKLKGKLIDDKHPEMLDNNNDGIKLKSADDIIPFCEFKGKIKFLMIQRKHTLGYIEFIRGRYNIDNVSGIIFLFKQMTKSEIKFISDATFDDLWCELWGEAKARKYHLREYEESKMNFEKLKEIDSDNENVLGLNFYVSKVNPLWDYPEWGFPKGRRNKEENDLQCATREFSEESGFADSDYLFIKSLSPIHENFQGTNGIPYKHIYFPALSLTDKIPEIDPENMYQIEEIGAIRWCSYEEAWELIRPHHEERKKFLTRFYMYLLNNIIDIYSESDYGAQ